MRIDRLDLTAFGPFTDVSLDLSARGDWGGLHLIHGPNEAGKSSSLRAIQQFFNGFGARSDDDFLHEYSKMRVGTVLRNREGETEGLIRRKGSKNTLLDAEGKALEDGDARLTRWLGGVGAADYVKKFVIDHEELILGGKEVLKAGGNLGSALFAAASGMVGLSEVQKQLDKEAEDLFKKGGKNPKINADLSKLESIKKETKEASLKGSEWVGHDQSLRDARGRKETLGREIAEIERRRLHLKRLADAVAPIAQRMMLQAELAELADVPRLSDDFTLNRRDSQAVLKAAKEKETTTLREIAAARESLATLTVPEPLLAEEKAIEGLFSRLGGHTKSKADRTRLEIERARFEIEAREALRELGRDASACDFKGVEAAIEPLRIRAGDRASIQELSKSREALLQSRNESTKALHKHATNQEDAAVKLAAQGTERDGKGLARALKAAQKPGEIEDQIGKSRQEIAKAVRKAESDLKKLGHWTGALDAVDSLVVPAVETDDSFDLEFKGLADEEADLNRRLETLSAESRKGSASLEKLRLAGDVPTEDALNEAREARDALWREIREAREWNDDAALEFEAATSRADATADRLRREAERVTLRAGLIAEQGRREADRKDLAARLEQNGNRRDTLHARWSALWSPLGIDAPGTPREMTAWLRRLGELVKDARTLHDAKEVLKDQEALVEFHKQALADALADLGEPRGNADESLADRIERAQAVIAAIHEETSDRKSLHKAIHKLESDRADLEDRALKARDDWNAWETAWAAALEKVGQSAALSPREADAVLEQTALLFERISDERNCREKLEDAAREAERFVNGVSTLAARVAPDLASAPVEEAVGELHNRLAAARTASQKRDAKTGELRKLEAAARTSRDEVVKTEAHLEALRREARCESDDALPGIEDRSRRRQVLETKLADVLERLGTLAAGTPVEAFLAEAAGTDTDTLAPAITGLDEQIHALNAERESLDQTIGAETTHLARMNGNADAAQKGQEAEDLRSRIRFGVEQYARLRLASAVLRTGIDRYREKAQGPVVERASRIFAALTLGSFKGLKVDYDDSDELVLVGVRGDGDPLKVDGMSKGTADQLYLALRLATLEIFLEGREPLPLIVDDILIQFDDDRTAATLKILAGFACCGWARTCAAGLRHSTARRWCCGARRCGRCGPIGWR